MEVTGRKIDSDTKTWLAASNEVRTCDPCKHDGLCLDAVGYCRNCDEYLCEICTKHHCRPKPCKDHIILRVRNESESMDGPQAPPIPPRRHNEHAHCDKHRMEMIKYICEIHNKRMCHACVTLDHKNCDNVKYLPDVISNKRKDLDFHIMYIDEKRTLKISNVKEYLQNSKDSYSQAKHAIAEHRQNVQKYFENIESTLEAKMKDVEEFVQNKLKEMTNLESSVLTVDEKLQVSDTLDKLDSVREDMEMLSKQIGDIHSKEKFEIISYIRDERSSELGELHYKFDEPIESFSLMKTIDATPEGEKGVSFKGSTLLPNGNLVFADYRNKRLVLADAKNDKGTFFYSCSEKPMEVSHIAGCDIAVLFPYVYLIQFFKVTSVFISVPDCDIELKDNCQGMKYDNIKRQLVLLSNNCIHFVDLKGNFLNEIALKSDSVLPNHLAIVPGKHVYYSDVFRHSVTCLGYDGNVIKEHRGLDGDLKGPYGLFVDSANILYICGVGMLSCVTPDGKWQALIRPEEGLSPQTIVMCEKRGLMFVGQARKRSSDILVFNINKHNLSLSQEV